MYNTPAISSIIQAYPGVTLTGLALIAAVSTFPTPQIPHTPVSNHQSSSSGDSNEIIRLGPGVSAQGSPTNSPNLGKPVPTMTLTCSQRVNEHIDPESEKDQWLLDLSTQVQDLTDQIQKLKERLDTCTSDAERERDAASQTKSTLSKDLNNTKKALERSIGKCRRLAGTVSNTRHDIQRQYLQHRDLIGNHQKEKQKLLRTIEELKARLPQPEHQVERQTLMRKVGDLTVKMHACEGMRQQQVHSYQQQILSYQQQANSYHQQVQGLQHRVSLAEQALALERQRSTALTTRLLQNHIGI